MLPTFSILRSKQAAELLFFRTMADGRRHSVDVPISRALVALRRVRSLRDPSTNSMSKFATLFDNLDADSGLSIGDSMHLESGCNSDVFTNCKNPAFMESSCKDLSLIGESFTPLSSSDDAEASSFHNHSLCRGDVDSCNGSYTNPLRELGSNDRVFHWRDQYRSKTQSSLNDELSDEDCDFQGCGLSYCWSRTPRLKSGPQSDVDDQPLLSGEIGKWKANDNEDETIPFEGSPRNLSQKFRPKMFKELVGQNVIIRSLSLAISSQRPSSMYLFHGPRGTGKTTVSRIFAAALNCVSQGEHKPCGSCYHCSLFFSGHSKDITFVDSVTISERNRIAHVMNRAATPPKSSAFKVIVFDECQLLRKDSWTVILNRLDGIPQHVVLIMITPDLEKLPHSAVSQAQKFRFQKIKDSEISDRLKKLCNAEGFEFEQTALDFIAMKSNGSLREAEMMLEQLSLSGKMISMSLTYEVTGIISDDELLELLEVALSPDTSSTVRIAREMMKSRIDPMQLTSQLANLIMDILAGKFQDDCSESRKRFFENHSSEADLQMLSRALQILSETEKQLRVSKNQSTWLTAALLQFSSLESNPETVDSKVPMPAIGTTDGEFRSRPSTAESLRRLVRCVCDGKTKSSGELQSIERLEQVWKKAIEMCQSSSLRSFLRKHGRLSSVSINQGVAVAKIEFWHRKDVTRAENSWKLIASSLQNTLGCNVEIQISLDSVIHTMKSRNLIKGCLKFLNCGRGPRQKSYSTETTVHSGQSVSSDLTSEKGMISDKSIETCGWISGQRALNGTAMIRDSQGNVLRTDWIEPSEALFEDTMPVKIFKAYENEGTVEDEFNISRKSQQSDFMDSKLNVPVYKKSSFLVCGKDASSVRRSSDKSDNDEGSRKKGKVYCWKTPSRLKKAWDLNRGQERKTSMWVLPCTADK